ncbi:MAG TPA: DNA ligase [Methylotenera sp.]|nr:DNA ligase [Methylotenera sp.]HPH06070.1 DNA ligase [Methylotenera sp.]HPN00923.1 DNA ligase [Methylotenera sp.]
MHIQFSQFFVWIWLLVCAHFSPNTLADEVAKTAQKSPDILLAHIYQRGVDVKQYLVSEKLDGVRAIWDGKVLRTRAGNVINAPFWFTKPLPATALDGELWLARRQFDALSAAVRKEVPVEAEWKNISYNVFELPGDAGTFEARAKHIEEIVEEAHLAHLKAVKQFRLKNEAELNLKLKQIVAAGGEGLMLHRADALYVTGRNDALLKLKLLLDAEATVIAHTAGRGKYQGKLGALVVQTPEGVQFKLGTGLSDAERQNPPKIGSVVTYTYREVTKNGKPKFASFLRVRND